jgi:hypothetical protein
LSSTQSSASISAMKIRLEETGEYLCLPYTPERRPDGVNHGYFDLKRKRMARMRLERRDRAHGQRGQSSLASGRRGLQTFHRRGERRVERPARQGIQNHLVTMKTVECKNCGKRGYSSNLLNYVVVSQCRILILHLQLWSFQTDPLLAAVEADAESETKGE